jgi:type IV pilus assembly protein PilV
MRPVVRHRGFSLIEILVTILVLSLGMLGLAGLMATSLRNGMSASHRTQATWMAYDIIDRLRGNRDGALAGTYASALGTPGACSTAIPGGTVPAQDLAAWKNQIACVLPAGDGSVTVSNVSNAALATVVIQWNDSRGTQGSATQSFTVTTRL